MLRPALFLVGPRGAGKSTAGRALASRVSASFVDADDEVEHRSGQTVSALFAAAGEAVFRRWEREVMLDLLQRESVIVATGGGCVLDGEVRSALARRLTVWLTAPLAVLQQRVALRPRPRLGGMPPDQELAWLVSQREPLYRECSVTVVDTSGRGVDEVVDELQHVWQVLPGHHVW